MSDLESRMTIAEGDITKLDVEAIVNAANSRLLPGSGVCGAIHRAAGPQLAEACEKIYRCPTGEARLTPGFKLRAKYVIHAVGPDWNGGKANEDALLASAYRSSLELARDNAVASIAFPAISTGIFGYPPHAAAAVAVTTVRQHDGELELVRFIAFDDTTLSIYRELLDANA